MLLPRVPLHHLTVFAKALRQYGTDFSVLSLLFPTRTRTQIRNKFKKEEKEHPKRIDDALANKLPIGIPPSSPGTTPRTNSSISQKIRRSTNYCSRERGKKLPRKWQTSKIRSECIVCLSEKLFVQVATTFTARQSDVIYVLLCSCGCSSR